MAPELAKRRLDLLKQIVKHDLRLTQKNFLSKSAKYIYFIKNIVFRPQEIKTLLF